jgi:hypothetical protein
MEGFHFQRYNLGLKEFKKEEREEIVLQRKPILSKQLSK